jgi:hypothetical protein
MNDMNQSVAGSQALDACRSAYFSGSAEAQGVEPQAESSDTGEHAPDPTYIDSKKLRLAALFATLKQATTEMEALIQDVRALTVAPTTPTEPPEPRQDRRIAAVRPYLRREPEQAHAYANIFDSPAYRDIFRSVESVEVYFAAGDGARRLATTFAVADYKIGAAACGNLIERITQHNQETYGSYWINEGKYVQDHDFQWFPSLLPRVAPLSRNSPVRVTPRTLTVALPEGLSFRDFEGALQRKLQNFALNKWLKTPEGRAHCRARDVDPALGARYTPYDFGAAIKMAPADELYVLSPKGAAAGVLAIAEQIVLEHLRLVARPSAAA